MNKYGGINDMPNCDKRVYGLWFQMLRRCYDTTQQANQTKYVLEANGVTLLFDSDKSACEFLGVKKCSVSSCYHKGYKCKGYRIAKMDGGAD